MQDLRLAIPLDKLREIVEKCLKSSIERVFIGVGLVDEDLYRVEEVFECKNVSRTPNTRFNADPLCVYSVYRYANGRGMDIVTIVHSHPMPPTPSAEDVKGMRLWRVPWLIVDSLSGSYRAWILIGEELQEVRIEEAS